MSRKRSSAMMVSQEDPQDPGGKQIIADPSKKRYKAASIIQKGYRKSKKGYRSTNIRSQVQTIVRSLIPRPEKKYQSLTALNIPLGQVYANTNTDGIYSVDVSVIPTNGTSIGGVIGAKWNTTCVMYNWQMVAQANPILHTTKYIIDFFWYEGANMNATTAKNYVYFTNPVNSFNDYLATRNPQYFKEFILLHSHEGCIDLTGINTQVATSTAKGYFKVNRRSTASSSGVVGTGQIFMFVRCDSGNSGSTTSTATGVITNVALSGFTGQFGQYIYFTDE